MRIPRSNAQAFKKALQKLFFGCLDIVSILVGKCTPVGSVESVVIGGYGFKPRRVMSIVV